MNSVLPNVGVVWLGWMFVYMYFDYARKHSSPVTSLGKHLGVEIREVPLHPKKPASHNIQLNNWPELEYIWAQSNPIHPESKSLDW